MIRSFLLLLPLAAAPLFAPRSAVLDPASAPDALHQDDDTPLQQAMQRLKKGQRSLKKLIADPTGNQQPLLDTLDEVEAAILVALGEAPPEPDGLDAKGKGLFRVGYKRQLSQLLEAAIDMEEATLNGDAGALKAGYEALSATKKQGHEAYRDF